MRLVQWLPDLAIRGVNYYPRDTPWKLCWTETPDDVWIADMERAASLHVNTVRIFIEENMPKPSGDSYSPSALARFDRFLEIASKQQIRSIVCISLLAKDDAHRSTLDSLIMPHRNDGRILMWDVVNEPTYDPCSTPREPYKFYFIEETLKYIQEIDPYHMRTVGFFNPGDVRELRSREGLDIAQYHEYAPSGNPGYYRNIIASVRRDSGGLPVLLGECGRSTYQGPSGITEEDHARLLEGILLGCEQGNALGIMPWCLLDFSDVVERDEQRHYGLYRTDYTLKPGGNTVAEAFYKWQRKNWTSLINNFAWRWSSANSYAESTGQYVGGIPNYHNSSHSYPQTLYGVIALKPQQVTREDHISASELLVPPNPSPAELISAAVHYAQAKGDAAGIPTFAQSNHPYPQTLYQILRISSAGASFNPHVSARDLGLSRQPSEEEICRAAFDYSIRHGATAGFPTFTRSNHPYPDTLYGIVLLNQSSADVNYYVTMQDLCDGA
jgi:hypothetical protein